MSKPKAYILKEIEAIIAGHDRSCGCCGNTDIEACAMNIYEEIIKLLENKNEENVT